jgi:Gluconate 2-dehydrogenase subunit 3
VCAKTKSLFNSARNRFRLRRVKDTGGRAGTGGAFMDDIARRAFIKGASIGALAYSVGGVEVLLTPREARAQGLAFKMLTPDEAATLEAIGDTLAIGARQAGIAHFVDQQLTQPPPLALLSVRVNEIRPPYVNFYRGALGAIAIAAKAMHGRKFGECDEAEQIKFVELLARREIKDWNGPAQPQVYAILRNDAVDVVYGTVEGFERVGVPYLPHILPEERW